MREKNTKYCFDCLLVNLANSDLNVHTKEII